MENQEVMEDNAPENASIQFISDEEVQATQEPVQSEPVVEQLQEVTEEVQQVSTEPVQENVDVIEEPVQQEEAQPNYSDEDIESAVFSYLSERLGRDVSSLDEFNAPQQQSVLDERVEAISRFVNETGRGPEDWFRYQQLNASEMDDLTAIKLQMLSDYNNLSSEELDTLVNSKYKLDPDLHTEEEVKLSQLQLKLDAQSAKGKIEEMRNSYAAPIQTETESDESFIDDQWVSNMRTKLQDLQGLEFELPNGEKFQYGLTDEYRSELGDKNARLDEFFDPYVQEDGSWDYDKLNMHRTVIDNIETIVQSVYKQGMSDGQRGLVNRAANVSTNSPNQGVAQPESNALADQLRNALGFNRGFGSNS